MTVPVSDRLSQLYVGNGTNTRFDFTFRIFQQEDATGVAVRKKGTTDFETIDPSTYTVTINPDDMGGYITFTTPPTIGTYFYIAGASPLDQLLDITNYDNFYPDAIERALDKLTALLQEWGTQLDLEKQARILADIHYDSLAMEREENLENRLISYINAVVGITNPAIFEGISDRMIITEDGRTQRDFNASVPFWTDDYVNFKQETVLREEQILDYTNDQLDGLNLSLNAAISAEESRAIAAENDIQNQVDALGGGSYGFNTYAEFDVKKETLPIDSTIVIAEVNTGSGTWGQGLNIWDGVSLKKSPYDPVQQSKDFANANPLFKPIILSDENLNDIKVDLLGVARTGTPTLAKNYPTTKPGYFNAKHIVTGSTGTLIPQTYMTFDGELWSRGTDSNGAVYQPWSQLATKADASKDLVALPNDTDVNTINKNGTYIVYSLPSTPTTSTHLPTADEQYIIPHFEAPANVKRQIAYARGSNSVYVRWYWGSFGWSAWDKLALTSELNALKAELTALIDSKTNLVTTFKLNLIDKLNGFNSVKLKLIGDSINWGVGASNTTATDPRTGYLTDPRNTTDPISPTWANLFRKFLAYAFGDRTITEDAPGSAYAKRKRNISFKQEIKKFTFKNAAGATVSEATALQVITANDTARNGEVMNLLGLNFVSSRQNEFTFDIVSDNVSVVYKKWSLGDANDNIEVFVDGVSKGTFNYFSETESYENVFSVTFPYGKHTIRVKNQATNANSYAHIQCCRTDQKIWLINEGIIGSSTKTWIDRNLFDGTINQYDDFVLMMLGTNDRGTVGGESGFKTRLNTCIDKINTLSGNNAKILLLTSAHVSDADEALPSRYYNMQEVDAIISSVAKTRLVGHISQVKYTTQSKIDDVNIWSDGLHLNDAGNKLLYENLRKQLFDS